MADFFSLIFVIIILMGPPILIVMFIFEKLEDGWEALENGWEALIEKGSGNKKDDHKTADKGDIFSTVATGSFGSAGRRGLDAGTDRVNLFASEPTGVDEELAAEVRAAEAAVAAKAEAEAEAKEKLLYRKLQGYNPKGWNKYGYHALTKTKFNTLGDDGKTEEGVSFQEFIFKPRQKTITRFKENEFDQYGILKNNKVYSDNYKKMIDFLEKGDEEAAYMYGRPLIEKILNYVLEQNKHFLDDGESLSGKIRFVQSKYGDFSVDKKELEDFIYVANKVMHNEEYNKTLSSKKIVNVIDSIMQWFASYNYNRDGFNQKGIHKDTLTRYDKHGYDKDGHDIKGYDSEGYNKWGYSQEGYDSDGYGTLGYDQWGYDKWGFDKTGYNKDGYDKFGYDSSRYNEYGFTREGIHKETHTKYDRDGKDEYGLDARGFHINGINIHTYTPYDKKGYNYYGFSKDGIHEETGSKYDSEGYNVDGFDKDGLNKDGFDRAHHYHLLRKLRGDKYLDAVTIRNMLKRLNELYRAKAGKEIYDTFDEKLQKMAKTLRHNVNRIIHEADEDVNIELARKISAYIYTNYGDVRIKESDLLADGTRFEK